MKKILLFLVLIVGLSACSSDDDDTITLRKPVDSEFCNQEREFIEEIHNRTGRLDYNNSLNKYFIYYLEDNAIDGGIRYIFCGELTHVDTTNLGFRVKFSGKSYYFNESPYPVGFSVQQRFLKLTSLTKID